MITTTQAARELGITDRRVRALIEAGRLPATKIGRDWMINPADLDRVRDRKPGRPPMKTIDDYREDEIYNDKGEPMGNGPKCATCGDLAVWGSHPQCERDKKGRLIVS